MKILDVLAHPCHFFKLLPTPKATKTQVFTLPSKRDARKCQIQTPIPLVLAFKKVLQNHMKCCVPRKLDLAEIAEI